MSKKENLNIISKLIKKINFLGNNQSLRDSIKDVIDEKSNEESQNIDLSSKEKSILSNILSINKLKADDVMIPRASIVAISQDSSFQNIIDTIDKELVSKINKQNKQMQGMFNARQLSFGLLDQAIHSESIPDDTWTYYNNLTKELVEDIYMIHIKLE